MKISKSYHIDQLRDYSTLFTRREVNRWFKSDLSSINLKINRYDVEFIDGSKTYLSYLKHIYRILERFYPNEYVYKNELINKWLIDELGTSDSIVYNEFRLGNAVADLAMFNGVSKAFEIKTILDKDARLHSQITEYHKLFNEVYIIVPETRLDNYINLYPDVGIVIFRNSNKGFELAKPATAIKCIEIEPLMQTLHTHEYIFMVEEYYGERPLFNDFNKFDICKKLIEKIPQNTLNDLFITTMKKRKVNNEFSKREKQLNQIFLSLNLSQVQQAQLLSNLRLNITI